MTRHIIGRGRLVGIGPGDARGVVGVTHLTVDNPDNFDMYTADPEVAAAIAADGLLFADVEVCLSRAGETTPADGERARYLAASADVARLERALATAESARDDWRREADHHASLGSEYLRVMALLAVWADAARRGEFVADEPTSADIGDDVLRELAVDVYAALRSLDPQRPHGPAADVERVVVAPDGDPGVTCACTDRRPKRRGHCTCGGRGGHSLACQFARADELAGYVDAEAV